MKRWLPSPWLSLALFASWLLLHRSVTPGHVLLGAAVAVAMPLMMSSLRPTPGPLRHVRVLAGLVLRVGRDVVRSAYQVGRGVLRAGKQAPRGTFVVIPLVLRDPHSLAALAMITTVVPGTVWSELAPDRSALLLHVFDLEDEAAFINHFKADYERPLQEIFE
jgi:multicomponent K+:H+ antiporter subunit E